MGIHPHGGLGGGQQGVSLVGEGEDHVELADPHAPEFLQHGQAVDQVAEVDEQGHEGHLPQGGGCRQQRDPKILPGPGVDGQGHKERPDEVVADGLQHQPEGDADGQITQQHRQGGGKGCGERFAVHGMNPLLWENEAKYLF